jgi:hypothetical protein
VTDDRLMGFNGVMISDHDILHVSNFAVLMSSSLWCDRIRKPDGDGRYLTGKQFVDHLRHEIADQDRDACKIIVLSAETFGHHIKFYQETFLRDMLFALHHCDSVRLCLVSELLELESLCKREKPKEKNKGFDYLPPSSWTTQPQECERGDPYPHWKSRGNPIHEKLWDLTNLILECCQDIDLNDRVCHDLRGVLDRAFDSTQYFWASCRFWRSEAVYTGIALQMRALYKCAKLTSNERMRRQGEAIYAELMWEIYKRSQKEERE